MMHKDTAYLCIDASAAQPSVGILKAGRWLSLHSFRAQALESIFAGTQQCLQDAGLSLQAIRGFIHCEGPGSVLGVRLSAMAIQSWRALPHWHNTEVRTYQSLQLVKAILMQQSPAHAPFHIISEARKDAWNYLSSNAETIQVISQAALDQLTGKVYHYRQRTASHQTPATAVPFSLNRSLYADLFYRETITSLQDEPTQFAAVTKPYKKWSNTRHR